MKQKKWPLLALALLVAVALGTLSLWWPPLAGLFRPTPGPGFPAVESQAPTPTPTPIPTPSPTLAPAAETDLSRLDRGVVSVKYTGQTQGRVKVQLTKAEGVTYNFDLTPTGAWETYPLTQGDGTYTLTVLEQLEGATYLPAFTQELPLALSDPLAPFLEPNQFVNYTPTSQASALAQELTAEAGTDLDKVSILFDYVVDHITYDDAKAAAVEPGYLPDVDETLSSGTGICFDYAALLCAMLRSVDVPCKLAVGDSGGVYHAWVEVWCETPGDLPGPIPIEADTWTLLDPTFVSSQSRSGDIIAYVTDPGNYAAKYYY